MTCHLDESLRIEANALRDILRRQEAEIAALKKELARYADACCRCPRAGGRGVQL